MNYGHITGGIVDEAIIATQEFIDGLPNASEWVELPYGVGMGWSYDGANFTDSEGNPPPATPPPDYRTLMTGPEWVSTFTDDEWDWIDTQRNTEPRTPAIKELRRLMDAIRWTNSIDVSAESITPFYDWLLNNGIPGGQTRIDELRQGVIE